MKWKYVLCPAFVARFTDTKLEIQGRKSGEWVDHSSKPEYWLMIEQDGTIVDEHMAREAHKSFKNAK